MDETTKLVIVNQNQPLSSDLNYAKSVIPNTSKKFLFVKRMSDIFGSIIGLIIFLPILFIVAICMKKDEPGSPIFFSQTRVGKDEKEFTMYKVRSMCIDAEEKLAALVERNDIEGSMFKMKEDPRITKIGKFIRKTSIDELPQLWNVLKGEMSLIGPRPPLPREVADYSNYDKQRLEVKPGCTGLWQVSGRNKLNFNQMVELDIRYINEQNLKNELKILIKTVIVLLKPNGAY